ncbi:MAG: alkaline phosphatase family protein, partial [Anaerolineae bacterium]
MTKVLMIGLDAAEPSLVEQWMATGHLPHLARLRAQASYGRMSLGKDWIAATPWPSFYTGRSVSDHGLYQFLQWRPQLMQSVRPHNDWLPLEPFWRQLSEAGPRVIAADVPLTYPSRPFNGIEVSAWASHDWLGPANTFPTGLLAEITRRLGKVPRQPEIHRMLAAEDMLAQRDELLEITGKVADLGEMLITENPWDFFLICFGATHRAGHKLWDRTSITPTPEHEQGTELEHALRDVYVACDGAIGRLSSKVDADTTVIVFSLHGMGPNNSRLNLLPEMLDRVLAGRAPNTSKGRQPEREALVQQLRKLMPEEWRERVKRRLPLRIQDRLTAFWRFGNRDWRGTRAFPLVGDLHGYVRVNLAGRESQGVVAPGQEY